MITCIKYKLKIEDFNSVSYEVESTPNLIRVQLAKKYFKL